MWPAHAVSRFRFEADKGQNVFTLAVTGGNHLPLRVAGLFLAPDTPAGVAFLEAHEQRQREAVARAFAPQERGGAARGERRPRGPSWWSPSPWARRRIRAITRFTPGAPPGGDLPSPARPPPRKLALHAARALEVHVEVRALVGPGRQAARTEPSRTAATCPRAHSATGRCGWRSTITAPSPISTRARRSRARCSSRARPRGRRARPLRGVGRLHRGRGGSRSRCASVSCASSCPPLPIPVGLLMSALPFGRAPSARPAGGSSRPRSSTSRRAPVSAA